MRVLLTIAIAARREPRSAFAQQPTLGRPIVGSSGCWPVTSRDRVVVTMDTGPARTGTLLCMGPEEIMLTGSGTLPLSTIRQISKPRDSALDGVLKGAAVGLVILVFCAPDCPGEYVLRATLGYAADRRDDRRAAGKQQDDLSARATQRRSHGASDSDAHVKRARRTNPRPVRRGHFASCVLKLRRQRQRVLSRARQERRGLAVDPRVVRVRIVRRQRMTALAGRHVHDAVWPRGRVRRSSAPTARSRPSACSACRGRRSSAAAACRACCRRWGSPTTADGDTR